MAHLSSPFKKVLCSHSCVSVFCLEVWKLSLCLSLYFSLSLGAWLENENKFLLWWLPPNN
jgi:hypothetical protein